jgi:hexosaminidase
MTKHLSKYRSPTIEIGFDRSSLLLVWEEVFANHDEVKPDTIIEAWKKENWEGMVFNITEAGLKAIVSSPWYLNYISYGSDAMKIYLEDPQAFGGTEEQERLVIGGEVSSH